MKRFTKHIPFIIGLFCLMWSQVMPGQGLEDIIVERYYVTDATDAGNTEGGSLANGSVTYRIFVDMAPGYKFLAAYGVPASPSIFQPKHALRLETTTTFFNNSDRGKETAEKIGSNRVDDNTTALDSWLSVGGSSGGHIAVLKSDDTDGSILGLDGLLTNDDPLAGIPLTTADGFIAGTPPSTNWLASGTDIASLFGESAGNTGPVIEITDGSWSSLQGSEGATEDNYVLIGQFTTDGIFSYELNVQIKDPDNNAEKYVARNPSSQQEEVLFPKLMNTVGKDIKPPQVSITTPIDGASIPLDFDLQFSVDVSDLDGTIDSVEYIIDGLKIGAAFADPFDLVWRTTAGDHVISAVAVDNDGARAVSDEINITVVESSNVLPTVAITSPTDGSYFSPDETVTITADASDPDGEIASVDFFIDDVLSASDTDAPYSYDWTAVAGEYQLRATATDNFGGMQTSDTIIITVTANEPPTVIISNPGDGDVVTVDEIVSIEATPEDTDGTISSVEFIVNGTLVETDTDAPYLYEWKAVAGAAELIAMVTDDVGDKGADTVSIIVNVPPTISFLSPENGDTISTGEAVTFTVDARDTDGAINRVEFYIDNALVLEDGEKPFEYTWTSAEGPHEIIARTFDERNASDADTINIMVMLLDQVRDRANRAGTINIYPNPATSEIRLQIQDLSELKEPILSIISITGVKMIEKTFTSAVEEETLIIDIHDLENGIYFVKVTSENISRVQSFIKQ